MAGLYSAFSTNPVERYQSAVNSKNYAGSSGNWADGSTGYLTGLGYPGDASRAQLAHMQGINSFQPGVNPSRYVPMGTGGIKSPTGGYGSGGPDSFSTLNNVKSNPFQNTINGFLGGLGNLGFNPNQNPNVLYSNVKNPAIQSAVNGMLGNLGTSQNPRDFTKSDQFQGGINNAYGQASQDSSTNRGRLSDFTRLFDASTPGITGNVGQENAAIGSVYGAASDPTSLQGRLNANASMANQAIDLSTNRAMDNLSRNHNFARLAGGDSSYANQQAIDTASGIYANAAQQKAALDRTNMLYVQQQQAALNGVRNNNLAGLATRQLQPIDALTRLGNAEDSRLFGIGAADLSNNLYTTPAEQAQQRLAMLNGLSGVSNNNSVYTLDNPYNHLSQQIGLAGQLQGMNNANNFYGLSKPYNSDASGFANYNMNPAPTGGGYNNNYRSPGLTSSYQNAQPQPAVASNGQPRQRSAAEEQYKQNAGVYPDQDPNFSSDLWGYSQQATAPRQYVNTNAQFYQPGAGVSADASGLSLPNDYSWGRSPTQQAAFQGLQNYYS